MKRQVREEVPFTDGRIIVQGKLHTRGKRKRADYILYYKPNQPIAIIEAKRNDKPVGAGMQQALEYAEILHIPFVFTSNGDSFVFHDKTITKGTIETEIALLLKLYGKNILTSKTLKSRKKKRLLSRTIS